MLRTKDLYGSIEFDHWAARCDLQREEQVLIERFLDPRRATVEGGTGGGRIAFSCRERGFAKLSAFDFVPELVDSAKRKDRAGAIDFRVGDVTRLQYADNSFEQLIYLQQVLCILDDAHARRSAIREAYRVLRPGGTALFSFLGYEARSLSWASALMVSYVQILRAITESRRDNQTLPWLRRGGKVNWSALLDRGPYTYWFRIPEVDDFLTSAGFQITAVATGRELALNGRTRKSCAELAAGGAKGTIYAVCRKPESAPLARGAVAAAAVTPASRRRQESTPDEPVPGGFTPQPAD